MRGQDAAETAGCFFFVFSFFFSFSSCLPAFLSPSSSAAPCARNFRNAMLQESKWRGKRDDG